MITIKINWKEEYENHIDDIIDAIDSQSGNLRTMSMVLGFRNRKPMCIRMWKANERWITGSKSLRKAIRMWATFGHGCSLVHFRGGALLDSTNYQRRLRDEIYPAQMNCLGNDNTYVYYLGKYGSGGLWNTVQIARGNRVSVPVAVCHFYSEYADNTGCDDFEEAIRMESEDGERDYRSYRVLGWNDGDITYDNWYVGTDGDWQTAEGRAKGTGSLHSLPADCCIDEWGI